VRRRLAPRRCPLRWPGDAARRRSSQVRRPQPCPREASVDQPSVLSFRLGCGLALERGVEGAARRGEIDFAAGLRGGARAVLPIHARVLPLHRQGALIPNVVERADQLLKVDLAVAGRAELPAATSVAEIDVTAQDAGLPVSPYEGVFDVRMVDAVGEAAGKE